MPNWITNELKASKKVLDFLQSEDSLVDFNTIIKFEGPHQLDAISFIAEDFARKFISAEGLDSAKLLIKDKPLLKKKLKDIYERSEWKDRGYNFIDECVLLIENYVESGFFHSMDFARSQWGTKWNACEPQRVNDSCVRFETAWSCPEEVLEKLSSKFPEELIEVSYADEDLGYNCGFFTLKNGEVLDFQQRDSSIRSQEYDKKWVVFAANLKGWSASMIKEHLEERYE